MDHKREHRTPPLTRVMGVGRQQQQQVWKKCICERIQEVGREVWKDGFNNT